MHACLHESHITAIRTTNHRSPFHIQALIFRQNFLHRVDVVEAILSAPVAVNVFGIGESVASGAAHIRHEDSESAQGEVLDQRHREPGEVGAFLSLRSAVDVVHDRARTFKAESAGGEIQPRGDAQTIVRSERGVFALRKDLVWNPQNLFIGMTHHLVALLAANGIDLRWGNRRGE